MGKTRTKYKTLHYNVLQCLVMYAWAFAFLGLLSPMNCYCYCCLKLGFTCGHQQSEMAAELFCGPILPLWQHSLVHESFLGKKWYKVNHSGNTWTFDFLSLYVENQLYQEAHSSGVGCSTASKILNPGKNWIGFYCFSCCNCLAVESEKILCCPTGASGNTEYLCLLFCMRLA